MPLLIIMLAIPTAEIFILIEIGGIIGTWPTIGLIVLTAVVGGAILRYQGLRTLQRAREQIARQQLPIMEIAEGATLAVAAVLLLTPGFFTDAIGALLLLPFLRRMVLFLVVSRLQGRMAHGFRTGHAPHQDPPGGPIIDGDFDHVDEAPKKDDTPHRDLPPPRR